MSASEWSNLVENMGFILYMRDRPHLNRTLAQIDHKKFVEVNSDDDRELDPIFEEARAIFLSEYNLPEFKIKKLHSRALKDLATAMKNARLPKFVIGLLSPREIKQLNKAVKEDDH